LKKTLFSAQESYKDDSAVQQAFDRFTIKAGYIEEAENKANEKQPLSLVQNESKPAKRSSVRLHNRQQEDQ